jgi:lysophospholipase L1-like esterase
MGKTATVHYKSRFTASQFPEIVVGAIGDSIVNNGVINGSNDTDAYSYAQVSWLFAGARQANGLWIAGPHFGVGGYTSAQILAAAPSWTPLQDPYCTHVCVMSGTNDIGSSLTAEQSIAGITAIWDLVLSTGRVPVACSLLPRASATDAQLIFNAKVNWYIRKAAARYGIPFADFLTACLDPASGNAMNWKTNYLLNGDSIHPGPAGAWAMGGALNAAIQSIAPAVSKTFPKAYYQGTAAGVLPANNLFRTLTGTINVSGSTPTSFATVTGSPVQIVYDQATFNATYPGNAMAPYGGSNVWELAIDSVQNFVTINSSGAPMTGFSAGDRVGFAFNFKVVPAGAEVNAIPGFQIGLRDAGNTAAQMLCFGKVTGTSYSSPNSALTAGGMADEGYIYLERSLPAGLTASGLCLYASMSQTAGKTGGKLLLSNLMVINYTTGGAMVV